MQILLGLILLQLLQSCDYSKSRDVLWMKKNSTCTGGYDRILSCKLNADSAIP